MAVEHTCLAFVVMLSVLCCISGETVNGAVQLNSGVFDKVEQHDCFLQVECIGHTDNFTVHSDVMLTACAKQIIMHDIFKWYGL